MAGAIVGNPLRSPKLVVGRDRGTRRASGEARGGRADDPGIESPWWGMAASWSGSVRGGNVGHAGTARHAI
jgi:hypothetical protein